MGARSLLLWACALSFLAGPVSASYWTATVNQATRVDSSAQVVADRACDEGLTGTGNVSAVGYCGGFNADGNQYSFQCSYAEPNTSILFPGCWTAFARCDDGSTQQPGQVCPEDVVSCSANHYYDVRSPVGETSWCINGCELASYGPCLNVEGGVGDCGAITTGNACTPSGGDPESDELEGDPTLCRTLEDGRTICAPGEGENCGEINGVPVCVGPSDCGYINGEFLCPEFSKNCVTIAGRVYCAEQFDRNPPPDIGCMKDDQGRVVCVGSHQIDNTTTNTTTIGDTTITTTTSVNNAGQPTTTTTTTETVNPDGSKDSETVTETEGDSPDLPIGTGLPDSFENTEDWSFGTLETAVSGGVNQGYVVGKLTGAFTSVKNAVLTLPPFSFIAGAIDGFGGDSPPTAPCIDFTAAGQTVQGCLTPLDPVFALVRAVEGVLLIFGFFLLMLATVRHWGAS